MELKGSKTEQNLLKAFAGESQARNRYQLFGDKAREEGLEQIAAVFYETAAQEFEHAKRFFSFLQGGGVTITAQYPAGKVGDTLQNLIEAAQGEKEEWSMLYNDFEEVARQEGFPEIAQAFKAIAHVEKYHEWRYLKLAGRIETDTLFNRPEPSKWQCRACGYVFEGKTPPPKCPACQNIRGYFEPLKTNY